MIKSEAGHFHPCGKCGSCRQNNVADWTFRLVQESKQAVTAWWICLTYADPFLVYNIESRLPELCKDHLKKFMRDLRNYQARKVWIRKGKKLVKTKLKIRFYAVGEYGEDFGRPHFHLVLWNAERQTINYLNQIWYRGLIDVDLLDIGGLPYMCKYHLNPLPDHDVRVKPFARMSRKPGIGYNYISFSRDGGYQNFMRHKTGMVNYIMSNGFKIRMPRYFRDKIFTEPQKAKMRVEAIEMNDRIYLQELERLCRLHPDPFNYMVERDRFKNDSYKAKANKSIKL